jgi:YgiT-type zinc finger domain-containing protein
MRHLQNRREPLGRATVTLNWEGAAFVVKNVPADVCDNCGEYYLSEEMTQRILALAEEAMHKGTEIEVPRWAT